MTSTISCAGTLLAAERIEDGTTIDLRTMERTRAIDAVDEVRHYTEDRVRIKLRPSSSTLTTAPAVS